MLSKVNEVGQIFALKVGRDRDRPETYDFEVLADVAVEYEKMKHVGLGPNIVECFGLVTDGARHALVLPRAHASLSDRLADKDWVGRGIFELPNGFKY